MTEPLPIIDVAAFLEGAPAPPRRRAKSRRRAGHSASSTRRATASEVKPSAP
jgi:hypothetical protein